MSRGVMSYRERKVGWRLTQIVLSITFILSTISAYELLFGSNSRSENNDLTSQSATAPTLRLDLPKQEINNETTTTERPAITLKPERSFTLVATGDLLIHEFVADRAADYGGDGKWDFNPMFRRVRPILAGADIALCHLETPLSSDNSDLSYYPGFRVPFQLASAIYTAGYDSCSLASNHTLDAGVSGVASTINHLQLAGVATTGAAVNIEDDSPAILEANGIIIAHLSYTDIMNGSSLPTDPDWRVPHLNVNEVLADAAQARSDGAEFVIASVHWGQEYKSIPTTRQIEISDSLLSSPNLDLLIGHHAHVPQQVIVRNGKYAVTGLGNFLSNQPGDERRRCNECPASTQDGMIAWFSVADLPDGSIGVVDAGYIPTWVRRASTYEIVPIGIDEPDDVDPEILSESAQRTASIVEPLLKRLTRDVFR